MDASGSVESNFALIQDLAKTIVWGLNFNGGRTRVGVITYQADANERFLLNEYTDKESVLNAIAFDQTKQTGTHTAEALSMMTKSYFNARAGDRTGVDNIAIILTDGNSNINSDDTIPEAIRAQDDEIHVMAVGVGRRVSQREIYGMVSQPEDENAFFMRDAAELNEVADLVLDQICEN